MITFPKNPKIEDLVTAINQINVQVTQNTQAIQAILTLLHPDPEHPLVTDEQVPDGEWLHGLVMHWIETYGRLLPPEGA